MPLWFIYALLGAACAALLNIVSKIGLKDINSDLATAIRSVVQALFVVSFALIAGISRHLTQLHGNTKAYLAIIAGGILGGLSWIFMFRALQVADVSKVSPIDKLSMPLSVLLAVFILKERPSGVNWAGILLIAGGAYLAAVPANQTFGTIWQAIKTHVINH